MKTNFTVRHFYKTSNAYAIFFEDLIIEMGQGTMVDICELIDDWLGKDTWFITDRKDDEEYYDIWLKIFTQ